MGHKGLYLDMSYFKAEELLHLTEYRKAIPHLTIYALPMGEKKLRSQMLIDFAKLQGYEEDKLKRLEEVLARAKDVDEAIKEFRRFKDDAKKGKFHIAKSEAELMNRLNSGWTLVQGINDDKFLLQKP